MVKYIARAKSNPNVLMKFGGVGLPPVNTGPASDILRMSHDKCPHCGGGCAGANCDESMLMKSDELSPDKARKILHDGTVHGKPITDRQRRFFGSRVSGQPIKKSHPSLMKAKRAASRDEYAADRPAHIDRDVEASDFQSGPAAASWFGAQSFAGRLPIKTHEGGTAGQVSGYMRNHKGQPVQVSPYTRRAHPVKDIPDLHRALENNQEIGNTYEFDHHHEDTGDDYEVHAAIDPEDKHPSIVAWNKHSGELLRRTPENKSLHNELHTAALKQQQSSVDEMRDWKLGHSNRAIKSHDHAAAARYHGRLAKALREHGETDLMNRELAAARLHNQLARERK